MGHHFTDQRETGGGTFPGVYVNPGTEPLATSTAEQAEVNMPTLIHDVGVSATFTRRADLDYDAKYQDGRYAFVLAYEGADCEVQMPGIPVELVRYMKLSNQNIWDFPRLYVAGSSWVWCYAISSVLRELGLEEK